MAMDPIQSHIAKLAFQADRRILHIEDEDHLRVDFSAHERSPVFPMVSASAPAIVLALPQGGVLWLKDYLFMAVLMFSLMFFVSNLPSTFKLGMANLSEAQSQHLASIEVLEGTMLSEDLWTGEKIGNELPLLEAREETVALEDGILEVFPVPSSLEDRISIPSLEINAPLVQPSLGAESLKSKDWNELEEQIRSSLLSGVVHYPGTANPGQKGNFFVTGHSSNVFWESSDYNSVFARLPKIEVGAEIVVTQDQKEYVYVVTSKKEVSPKDVSVLSQGEAHQMTLMTCTPVGTTLKRLVVTAELKS